jgi:hypothetical protein
MAALRNGRAVRQPRAETATAASARESAETAARWLARRARQPRGAGRWLRAGARWLRGETAETAAREDGRAAVARRDGWPIARQ